MLASDKGFSFWDGYLLLLLAWLLFSPPSCENLNPGQKACQEACRCVGAVSGEKQSSWLKLCRCYRDKGMPPFDMVIGK